MCTNDANNAIIIAEENESPLGIYAMLELHTLVKGEEMCVRRGHALTDPLLKLLKSVKVTQPFVVLSIDQVYVSSPKVLYSSETSDMAKGM